VRRRAFVAALAGAALLLGCPGESEPAREVVVYCALDRLYAQPVLEAFARETGIKVRPKWDTEATKTTGLVQAIRSEKDRVRCDVFWNNEVSQTIALANEGLLAAYPSPAAEGLPGWALDPGHRWTGFAARARVLIVNTDLVSEDQTPSSVDALLDPAWKGKVGIAKPLFGTTVTHVAALWAQDAEAAQAWLAKLKANEVVVCAGNADVKDRVVAGELAFGLTDTDDANLALQAGAPVRVVFPDQAEGERGTLLIPNAVSVIAGAPHEAEAKLLVDYLLRAEVERALAASRSVQIPLRKGIERAEWIPKEIRALQVDWQATAKALAPSREHLQSSFLAE
jgi:iron(III) transport system substrate-binding protein